MLKLSWGPRPFADISIVSFLLAYMDDGRMSFDLQKFPKYLEHRGCQQKRHDSRAKGEIHFEAAQGQAGG